MTILVNEKQDAGFYTVPWNGNDKFGKEVASGVYFYRLLIKVKNFDYTFTRKMVKLQ